MDGHLERGGRLEFDAAVDGADDILAALRAHGVAKVAHIYDPTLIADIAASAKKIYKDRDFAAAMGTLDPGLAELHGKLRSISLGDIVVRQGLLAEILVTPFLRRIAEQFLDKPVVPHEWSFSRCARAGSNVLQLPFHQDMRLVGIPLVNIWIPLMACGVEIPGLEVVVKALPDLLDTTTVGENFYAKDVGVEIAAEQITRAYGAELLWHPVFEPGEALIFQGTTVHRTYGTPAMKRERISIDLRLV